MGGFVLVQRSDDGEVTILKTIQPKDLGPWIEKKQIPISEYQLCDRSKGDGLTKTLAVLQTGWFILQFFARLYQRLGITELELVTMAYAVLNIGTYGFWWNKPLNVECPVQLSACEGADLDKILAEPELEIDSMYYDGRLLVQDFRSFFPEMFYKDKDVLWYWRVVWTVLFPLLAVGAVMADIVVGSFSLLSFATKDILEDHSDFSDGQLYWRYFHGDKSNVYAGSLAWVLAALFGAVHCAAWPFAFPSVTEKIIWRVCALTAALFPAVLALLVALEFFVDDIEPDILRRVLKFVGRSLIILSVALYIGARCILIIQMFLLLRFQPDNVYTAIDWVKYIPHL